MKFLGSRGPLASAVYFPACSLLEWAGRTTAWPFLYQVTKGGGFPLTSQLRRSPSLTCSLVGQRS